MWARFWTRLRLIQSNVYLPATRTGLLVGALGAFLVAALGLLTAGYFQTQSWHSAPSAYLPSSYVPQNPKIALNVVATSLTGPTNIRFISYQGIISSPLSKYEVIGQFEADTVNGLAAPPNDFSLLGGTDVGFFTPARPMMRNPLSMENYPHLLNDPQGTFRYGLVASQTLNDLVRKAVAAGQVQSRSFNVRVIAFDKLGNKSAPQNINFTLRFGPAPPTPAATIASAPPTAATPPVEPTVPQTPLTVLAHDIALVADPKRGPTFFNVFRKAVDVPRACGVDPNNAAFIADYRSAFEFTKGRLTPDNVVAGFLPSVCKAWQAGVAAEGRAESAANAARLQAMAAAQAAKTRATLLNAAARAGRDFALSVVLGAVALLLLISLPLALLLLESHSSALRAIAERIEAARAADHTREDVTS